MKKHMIVAMTCLVLGAIIGAIILFVQSSDKDEAVKTASVAAECEPDLCDYGCLNQHYHGGVCHQNECVCEDPPDPAEECERHCETRFLENGDLREGVCVCVPPYRMGVTQYAPMMKLPESLRVRQDFDGDAIPDELDNCPTVPNPDQANCDEQFDDDFGPNGLKLGDMCDPDRDR